jgi:hypothetical protein
MFRKIIKDFRLIKFSLIRRQLFLSLVFLSLISIISVPTFALNYTDNSLGSFNAGSYSNTFYNTTSNYLELNTAGRTAGIGTYNSAIKSSASINTVWSDFGWLADSPYTKELPDNLGAETYPTGNANMTGNYGLFHLNESSGSLAGSPTFADSSGSGNNIACSLICPTPSTDAVFNTSSQMSALALGTQYFILPNTLSVKSRSAFTISMWIKPTVVNVTQVLWSELSSNGSRDRFLMTIQNNGRLRLQATNNDSGSVLTLVTSNNSLVANSWNHVVGVFNSTTDVHKVYVNNTLTQGSRAINPFPATNPASAPQFMRKTILTTSAYRGNADEIALFNREITATENQNLYTRGILNARFQIRSCDDSLCVGESFVGPDGTATSFYTNTTSNGNISFGSLPISANRYFQYRATLNTRAGATFTPKVTNLSIDYTFAENSLAFSIRNSTDTTNQNSCNLGILSTATSSSCTYRIKVETNATNGYTVYVQTDGGLTNGSYSFSEAGVGTGGGGGNIINNSTAGTEKYGIVVNPGSVTGGGVFLNNNFNAGSNSVKINSPVAVPILAATGPNLPGSTDTTNTTLVTHNANISGQTEAGNYSQRVIYTVVPSF